MIPVGTLCIVIGTRRGHTIDGRPLDCNRFNGRIGVVDGHRAETRRTHGLLFPNSDSIWIDPLFLRPIAPPGDPDRVDTPQREPAEVCR